MGRIGRSSLVDDMSTLRSRGLNANHRMDMVVRKGDATPSNWPRKVEVSRIWLARHDVHLATLGASFLTVVL